MVLSLSVDDILLARNNLEILNETKSWFSSTFEIKDMGEAIYVLAIRIIRNVSKDQAYVMPKNRSHE